MKPILITGATGTLGAAFARACDERGLRYCLTTRAELDIAMPASVAQALAVRRPWLVINTAGYVRVDDAEQDADRCHRENVLGAGTLAQACHAAGIALVTFSSDLVFDGAKGSPYDEADLPRPLGVYGTCKLAAEAAVRSAHPGALVIRTSALFGPDDEHNWVTRSLRELAAGRAVRMPPGVVSPTYVPDLVNATLDLAVDGDHGLWHIANAGVTSWIQLIRQAAAHAGMDPGNVAEADADVLGLRAARPRFSALKSRRHELLGPLDDAIARYAHERGRAGW